LPLLLVDMDDTLVDRTATAHRWAATHVPRPLQPLARPLLAWLVRRFQAHRLVSRLAALYERNDPRSYVLEPGVREALEEFDGQGGGSRSSPTATAARSPRSWPPRGSSRSSTRS
jgi:beta-phosphoglucomutase-like phosphatase (HAD superfamily)